MILDYFTFHNVSDSFKFITAVLVSLVLASRTTYDLLPFKLVPDIHLSFWGYFLVKCFAIVILLRILSQTEFPFRAIENLVSSVRDRFTRNELEYDGFTLIIAAHTKTALPEADLCNYMVDYDDFSGSRKIQSNPLREFTIQNLMAQVLVQQWSLFITAKSKKEYLGMYLLKLMHFLQCYFDRLPCHPACLDILNRPSEYQFQHDVDPEQSPLQLLFSRLQHGLALTQDQYKRSGLGEPALDRDIALLRYFLIRILNFHWLRWVYSNKDSSLLDTAPRTWDRANLYYAKVREVSLDLEAELPTPWLRRAIEALFDRSGHPIISRYAEPKTKKEYVIFRTSFIV